MKVAIIGGGISGLATAYYLQKSNPTCQITLIEREGRLGGKIITDTPQGFVIEGGPDSFITQKPYARQLCAELGLEMIGTNDERRNIFILRRGKLHKMPDGLMLIVPTRFLPFAMSPLISWWGKIRMGMDLFIPHRKTNGDESIADFMRRRLGQEALDVLGEPMLAGIYVADAETLSLQATFPRFSDLEQKYGSLTRGMIESRKNAPPAKYPMFMTMKNGLQELVCALEQKFQGELIQGIGAQTLIKNELGWSIELEDGRHLSADEVVLATPAYVSGRLLAESEPELAEKLGQIRYVSTATVSLGYSAADLGHTLDGFGFVIPRNEPTPLLACTWTSTKFNHRAPEEHVLIRTFIGGPHQDHLVSQSDETLLEMVQTELAKIMGINTQPILSRVFRWKNANPQYEVGHLDRVSEMETLCPDGLYLTGSAYRGVGLPDCIHQAQQTAEKIVAHHNRLVYEHQSI